MDTNQQIEQIKSAREILINLIKKSDTPQIETILRAADMELHCALWNLGVVTTLRPEQDYV